MTLNEFFKQNNKLALAFSGGVDSAFLFYAAKACGVQLKAYFVKTPFQPEFELEDAKRLAEELKGELCIINANPLESEIVAANPENRCYYCKQLIFSQIREYAAADGFTTIIDGTNASDDAGDRPGMKALTELEVLSPLRLCGLTKDEIRRLSKAAGLFTWDKPSYACLATRIPAGERITEEKLAVTEKSEAFLAALGFSDFRVRQINGIAKIQIKEDQLPLLMQNRKTILSEIKTLYRSITLDLETR